jgi:hypothetical protein
MSAARSITAGPGLTHSPLRLQFQAHRRPNFRARQSISIREASSIHPLHPIHESNPPSPRFYRTFTMAGVAYYNIAGKQVGGHYVSASQLLPLRRGRVSAKLTCKNSWPWAGWPPSPSVSSTPPPAAAPSPTLPLLLPSTPQAPMRPTSSSARIQWPLPPGLCQLTGIQEVFG